MQLYLRFFDREVLVNTVDEAFAFLSSINGFEMSDAFVKDFTQYAKGSTPYPKRYKVHTKSYFIVIKTTAKTLAEFKANHNVAPAENTNPSKANLQDTYQTVNPGWYEAQLTFNRVLPNPQTGKLHYVPTYFEAHVKASSVQECYDRVMAHLKSRKDIDCRSQFPSIKGKNFQATFLGVNLKD